MNAAGHCEIVTLTETQRLLWDDFIDRQPAFVLLQPWKLCDLKSQFGRQPQRLALWGEAPLRRPLRPGDGQQSYPRR